MAGVINIGCSGYSYDHWRGVFYPEKLPAREFLEHYCRTFNAVELNVTFYRLPPDAAFRSWAARTPPNFVFVLKGSRYITHLRRLNVGPEELARFFGKMALLDEKGRAVLWQLPPEMEPDFNLLRRFLDLLQPYRRYHQFFEFRHPGWLCIPTLKLLLEYGGGLCGSDWPEVACPELWCGRQVYFRRHGPDGQLYSGGYPQLALKRDAELIRAHAAVGRDVYLFFNNDGGGMAVHDARAVSTLSNRTV